MKNHYDFLVIGAGPAGLQMGYYLARQGYSYLILDQEAKSGSFFQKMPRHGYLISINKVHTGIKDREQNLRWDWNSLLSDDNFKFTTYTDSYFPKPSDLVRYLNDFKKRYKIQVENNTRVTRVSRKDGIFRVKDSRNRVFKSSRLIVATGVSKEYIPDIPGIELCETYGNHSLNLRNYRNKRVLLIGKSNSAFETAEHLFGVTAVLHMVSPNSIRMAWDTHFVGNLRAVNNNFLDTYQLKSQNAAIDATVERIRKRDGKFVVNIKYSHAMGQTRELVYDRVISCTGFRFDASIFDENCRPELMQDDRLPAQTTAWESVNVPDLYFAGTLMQACDYKKTMSGFIHGFRHNIRTLSRVLDERYSGKPWPAEEIPASVESVLQKVIHRINVSPGVFLQPGFLCDVVAVDGKNGTARCYEDVRKDHIPNSFLGKERDYYVVSLEYGKHTGNPFSVMRDPSPDQAHKAFYLHPVIRRFSRKKLVSVHHINDDLENEWMLPEYVDPARAYFSTQLKGA